MNEKDLKRLSRQELLEMLLAMSKAEKRLQERIESLEEQLQDRKIAIEQSGSLAEASIRLNQLFESADKAVEIYAFNVKNKALNEAKEIILKAKKEARTIIVQAQSQMLDDKGTDNI